MGNISDIQWNLSSLWCWWGIMAGVGMGNASGICPLFGVGGA